MPTPETTDSFLSVASQLILAARGELPAWNASANATHRSAASRAYYSGLITLRLRLDPHLKASGASFPTGGTHHRIRAALLQAGHRSLAAGFDDLRRIRENADYEWGPAWGEPAAKDAVRKAGAILARVNALSASGLKAIAREF